MRNKRLIPALCVQVNDNEFKPVWELEYVKSDTYGEGFRAKDDSHCEIWGNMIECYWDTKKHKIVFGKIKNIIPDKTTYVKGESVYVETERLANTFYESVVVDILFEKYETYITHVKKLRDFEIKKYFGDEVVDQNDIFELRHYKPTYVLAEGRKVEWEHMLKHKFVSNK